MESSVCLLFTLLNIFLAAVLVSGQDQPGFISLDCGSPPDTNYVEEETGISYKSDANFIDTGVGGSIKPEYQNSFPKYLRNLRSFPEGSRNCYSLPVTQGDKSDKYLIRATFLYGNYDGLNKIPKFDLHLGPNFWTSVYVKTVNFYLYYEMIHVSKAEHLQVCLVKNGSSTPFISALELRKLPATAYVTQNETLQLFDRYDIGSTSERHYRYNNDSFDRIWQPLNYGKWEQKSTIKKVSTDNDYNPPEIVMSTASVPTSLYAPMTILLKGFTGTVQLFVFLHIAEIQVLNANAVREFVLLLNGKQVGELRPADYLVTRTMTFPPRTVEPNANGECQISLQRTAASTLPPLLNALEVYMVNFLPEAETDKKEVDAMLNIKSRYNLNITSWQGDPCAPQDYRWDHLNCSYNDTGPPKITSLDLSSSGLNGTIPKSISDLTNLETLDLSNNSLTGSIPDFLADLEALKVINLSANKFSGSVPAGLLDKRTNGSIKLSIEGNPGLDASASSNKKKKKTVIAIVVASLVLLLVVAFATLLILKKKESSARAPIEENRRLTYSEVQRITNFKKALGSGGFGEVYYGVWGKKPVAVKMLNESSAQGYKEFRAEVELLLRVHHRNLTSLIGYCDDTKLTLIYEFMENGDLKKRLSGESGQPVLTWEKRLQIAIESAQGLEYLHKGCQQQIIHRDVKTTNILLNDELQAKLADFGLSRSFPAGNETPLSTRNVAGTPGYLDPEYRRTNKFSIKSDVYSFGVVLLEIITNRAVDDPTREGQHIGDWVRLTLTGGDINAIVDPKLLRDFDVKSVTKAVELAMACLKLSPVERPTMSEVVQELKESLKLEEARKKGNLLAETIDDPRKEPTPGAK